jgi:hypothetical protein
LGVSGSPFWSVAVYRYQIRRKSGLRYLKVGLTEVPDAWQRLTGLYFHPNMFLRDGMTFDHVREA